jgi:hypothetical protein
MSTYCFDHGHSKLGYKYLNVEDLLRLNYLKTGISLQLGPEKALLSARGLISDFTVFIKKETLNGRRIMITM